MATTAIVFKPTRAKIDVLELDASLTERHAGDVEVTDHPVEQGANISDHARAKPETITIEGIVSNTPIVDGSQIDSTAAAGRAADAHATLRKLKDAGSLVTVVTSLRQYENMVITGLEVPRDVKIGDALRFTVTLKQIRVVQNKTVAIPTKLAAAKPKQDLGKKPGVPADDETVGRSLLKSGADWLGITK